MKEFAVSRRPKIVAELVETTKRRLKGTEIEYAALNAR